MKHKTYYSTGELAAMFEVATRTVSKWCDDGRLQFIRYPGGWERRIRADWVMKFCHEYQLPISKELQDAYYSIQQAEGQGTNGTAESERTDMGGTEQPRT